MPVPPMPSIDPRAVLPAARRCLAVALLGVALAACGAARAETAGEVPAAPPAASAEGFIRTDGRRLVAPDGSTFDIRGMSIGNWLVPEGYMFKFEEMQSPREIDAVVTHLVGREAADAFWARFRDTYVGRDDIAFLKAAGFTTIRVPLHWGLFVTQTDPARPDAVRFEGEGWRLIDRLLGWCRETGMKVILDMHAAPGGQTGVNHDDGTGYPMTFYVPAYRRLTIALWQEIARRYRDETAILGYDLLNEPISPYHDVDFLNDRLEPLYRDITRAIREVDPNHLVIVAGAQWSTNFDVFGPPFADNVVYTYHKFWASPERRSVQEYVDFGYRWDVPILLGETGEYNDTWNAAYREVNEHFGIGWSYWTYKNLDTPSTIASIRRPPGWDAIAKVGSTRPESWPTLAMPSREAAAATLEAYLDNLPLARTRINRGYVESLAGVIPPEYAAAASP